MSFGTRLGFGFTERMTLHSGLDLSFKSTQDAFMQHLSRSNYALGHFDVGAQLNFRGGSNGLVPYVETEAYSKTLGRQ